MRGADLAAGLLLALAAAGCASRSSPPVPLEDPVEVPVEGPYRHEPSGMVFPPSIGPFVRERVFRYDADGRDVSVGYNAQGGARVIVATVYVRPAKAADMSGRGQIEEERAAILLSNPSSRKIAEQAVRVTNGGEVHEGTRVTFLLEDAFGIRGMRAESLLYVFPRVGGDWIVKYRFTYPVGAGDGGAVATLLRDLAWPR